MLRPPVVLSIAGFDGSGGAGIQADLKTFSAFGCYGMTVLTALPVQNTCGVKSCFPLPLTCIREQLETIFDDIRPDVIKVGMLYNASIIAFLHRFLEKYGSEIPLVLDPVMVAKSGSPLLHTDAISSLKEHIIPLSTIITPNLLEAQALGTPLAKNREQMVVVAEQLLELGGQGFLLKGGHLEDESSSPDLYRDKSLSSWLEGERITTKNNHGTGCTLSAALSCCLALGYSPLEACRIAKNYLLGALKAAQAWTLGSGHGPLNHAWAGKPFLKRPCSPTCEGDLLWPQNVRLKIGQKITN